MYGGRTYTYNVFIKSSPLCGAVNIVYLAMDVIQDKRTGTQPKDKMTTTTTTTSNLLGEK